MLCARHYTSTARIYGSEYFIFYCIKTWPPPTSLLKINPDPANAIISVSRSTVMAIVPPAEMLGRAMICVLQKLVLVKSVRLSQTNSPLKLLTEDDTRKNIPLHRLRTKIGTRFLAILLNRSVCIHVHSDKKILLYFTSKSVPVRNCLDWTDFTSHPKLLFSQSAENSVWLKWNCQIKPNK